MIKELPPYSLLHHIFTAHDPIRKQLIGHPAVTEILFDLIEANPTIGSIRSFLAHAGLITTLAYVVHHLDLLGPC